MATHPSSHALRILILSAATVIAFAGTAVTQSPRFYADDPLAREPESQDAAAARPNQIETNYEMVNNLFVTAGYTPSGTRAQNINTIDEVPDSGWFTNRIGTAPLTAEQIARGTNSGAPPDPSRGVLKWQTHGSNGTPASSSTPASMSNRAGK